MITEILKTYFNWKYEKFIKINISVYDFVWDSTNLWNEINKFLNIKF